jgi:hypothetical protein
VHGDIADEVTLTAGRRKPVHMHLGEVAKPPFQISDVFGLEPGLCQEPILGMFWRIHRDHAAEHAAGAHIHFELFAGLHRAQAAQEYVAAQGDFLDVCEFCRDPERIIAFEVCPCEGMLPPKRRQFLVEVVPFPIGARIEHGPGDIIGDAVYIGQLVHLLLHWWPRDQ